MKVKAFLKGFGTPNEIWLGNHKKLTLGVYTVDEKGNPKTELTISKPYPIDSKNLKIYVSIDDNVWFYDFDKDEIFLRNDVINL